MTIRRILLITIAAACSACVASDPAEFVSTNEKTDECQHDGCNPDLYPVRAATVQPPCDPAGDTLLRGTVYDCTIARRK